MKRKKAAAKAKGKAKGKVKVKARRKRAVVKDMPARKASTVKGGLLPATTAVPAVQHKVEAPVLGSYKILDGIKSIK
jgi:hypothetical protein